MECNRLPNRPGTTAAEATAVEWQKNQKKQYKCPLVRPGYNDKYRLTITKGPIGRTKADSGPIGEVLSID